MWRRGPGTVGGGIRRKGVDVENAMACATALTPRASPPQAVGQPLASTSGRAGCGHGVQGPCASSLARRPAARRPAPPPRASAADASGGGGAAGGGGGGAGAGGAGGGAGTARRPERPPLPSSINVPRQLRCAQRAAAPWGQPLPAALRAAGALSAPRASPRPPLNSLPLLPRQPRLHGPAPHVPAQPRRHQPAPGARGARARGV
jgi:hypothetical protein